MKALGEVATAALGTFVLTWLIGVAAMSLTGVPKGFPPFTPLPLLSGVIGGFLSATLVYRFIGAISTQPTRTFLFVSMAVLVLSFGLPLLLSFTRSPRFVGVTPSAQMTLLVIHTVVAASAVTVLTRMAEVSSR